MKAFYIQICPASEIALVLWAASWGRDTNWSMCVFSGCFSSARLHLHLSLLQKGICIPAGPLIGGHTSSCEVGSVAAVASLRPPETESAGELSSLIQMEKSDDNLFLSQSWVCLTLAGSSLG